MTVPSSAFEPGTVVEVSRLLQPSILGVVIGPERSPPHSSDTFAVAVHTSLTGSNIPRTERISARATRLRRLEGLVGEDGLAAALAIERNDGSRVEYISDPHILARVAGSASDPAIRIAALDRITDRDVLIALGMEIERVGGFSDIAPRIIERLGADRLDAITDERILTLVAVHARDSDVRAQALARVYDPDALRRIACASYVDTAKSTLERLDGASLLWVSQHASREGITEAADARLADIHRETMAASDDQADLLAAAIADDSQEDERVAAARRFEALIRTRGPDPSLDPEDIATYLRTYEFSDDDIAMEVAPLLAILDREMRVSLAADNGVDDRVAGAIIALLDDDARSDVARESETVARCRMAIVPMGQPGLVQLLRDFDWGTTEYELASEQLIEIFRTNGAHPNVSDALADIAVDDDTSSDLRMAIAQTLDDDALLERIVREVDTDTHEGTEVARAAIERISDTERFTALLSDTGDADVASALIARITNPYALACFLADDHPEEDVAGAVAERLKELLAPDADHANHA